MDVQNSQSEIEHCSRISKLLRFNQVNVLFNSHKSRARLARIISANNKTHNRGVFMTLPNISDGVFRKKSSIKVPSCAFSLNSGKYRQEKLRIWTLVMQCLIFVSQNWLDVSFPTFITFCIFLLPNLGLLWRILHSLPA